MIGMATRHATRQDQESSTGIDCPNRAFKEALAKGGDDGLDEMLGAPRRELLDEIPVPRDFIRCDMKPMTLTIFLAMVRYYHMQELLSPRVIAGEGGISVATVSRHLPELIEHGWVGKNVERTKSGKHLRTTYSVHLRADGPGHPIVIVFPEPEKRKEIPPKVWVAVLERDKFQCVQCGSISDLTADHIIPRAKGGTDSEDNLQVLCGRCNSRKGATVEGDL